MNRDTDILQGKTPRTSEQMSIPDQSTQAGAECLDFRAEAGFPHLRLMDLFIICRWANSIAAFHIRSRIPGAAMVKHPNQGLPE